MKIFKIYFFALLLLFSSSLNAANDTSLTLTQKQWEEISKGVDYTETFKESEKESKKASTVKSHSRGYDLSKFKYPMYALVIGLVLFLIIKILSNFNIDPSIKEIKIGIDSIEEIEEKIHELDLEQLLAEALQANNFRIALRINFLIIIKLLSQKGAINWAREKTNWEYHGEIHDRVLSDRFKEIILCFELVWYGEHPFTEEQFDLVRPSYENLKKQLSTNE